MKNSIFSMGSALSWSEIDTCGPPNCCSVMKRARKVGKYKVCFFDEVIKISNHKYPFRNNLTIEHTNYIFITQILFELIQIFKIQIKA